MKDCYFPEPQKQLPISRNNSMTFSPEELMRALQASATKPRQDSRDAVLMLDQLVVPPPSPHSSRPSSIYGGRM